MVSARRAATIVLALCTCAAAPSDEPLLVVGSTSYSIDEVRRWLEVTPIAQRGSVAPGEPADLRTLIHRAVVPEALLQQHARQILDSDTRFRTVRDAALAESLTHRLEEQATVTPEQIEKFYSDNLDRYVQPEAIQIWRILAVDEATAKLIIERVDGRRLGVAEWSKLARQFSKDSATKQRDGDLGFVRADGSTDVPQVRVAPGLHEAASKVRDGQLVKTPIEEADGFAVIWRRGTRPAASLSLDSQRQHIATILRRNQAQKQRAALVDDLRKKHLRDYAPALLKRAKYDTPQADRQRRSPLPSSHPAAAPPQPKASDRGER
jgi:hypothetical protein